MITIVGTNTASSFFLNASVSHTSLSPVSISFSTDLV